MANPTWFVFEDYMTNKLAQLQASEPDAGWTAYSLAQAFANEGYVGEEGAYQHFLNFGMDEDVSPNALFDAETYYVNKLAALKSDSATAEEWADKSVADVKAAFAANGLSAWEHYQQFGTAEGINPSAEFDTVKYLEAKAAALNAEGGEKVWTAADVADALAENGWSALEHYEMFGKSGAEGEVAEDYDPTPVVTLTFADALAADPLPTEYFLADGAASLDGVAIADLEATQTKAQSIFDGALNKDDLEYSVVYTLKDSLENILDRDNTPLVAEAGSYTLTDGVLNLEGHTISGVESAVAAAEAAIAKATNADTITFELTYTLTDTLANLMASENADVFGSADSYEVTDGIIDLGAGNVEAIQAALAAADTVIKASTNEDKPALDAAYTLTDSLQNLFDNKALTEGHTYSVTDETTYTFAGPMTAADAATAKAEIDAFAKAGGVDAFYQYALADTLQALVNADVDFDMFVTSYTVTEAGYSFDEAQTIEAIKLAQSNVNDVLTNEKCTNGAEITPVYEYTVLDSLENIAAAQELIVDHDYALTDAKVVLSEVTVAGLDAAKTAGLEAVQTIIDGATNADEVDVTYSYILNDTVEVITGANADVLAAADGYILTDSLENLKSADNIIFNGADKVFVKETVAVIDDASVADATFINSLAGIIYEDTFANLQDADRIGDTNVTYTLTDTATKTIVVDSTVADVAAELAAAAAFVAGATNAEDYEDTEYGYTITDTIANIKGAANEVLAGAEEDGVTVRDTLSAFNSSNDILTNAAYGVDDAIATVASDATISTATMTAIADFDSNAGIDIIATAASAVTVDASKDTEATMIDLTKFEVAEDSEALTFNAIGSAEADTITAHKNGGTITGGEGADTITLGDGNDVVAYTATTLDALKLESGSDDGADDTLPTTGDEISEFTTGSDTIQFTVAIQALLADKGIATSENWFVEHDFADANAAEFEAGAGARFIYDETSQTLYLDVEGDTAQAAGDTSDSGVISGAADDIVIATGISLVVDDIIFA